MKKTQFLLLLLLLFSSLLLHARGNSSQKNAEELNAKTSVVVSIAPLSFVVEYISDGVIPVYTLVEEKESPETYNLSVKEFFLLEQASIFFSMGSSMEKETIFEFERMLPDWLRNKNSSAVVVELAKNVELLHLDETVVDLAVDPIVDPAVDLASDPAVGLADEDHLHADEDHLHAYDIHFWLSPDILGKIATQVHDVLAQQFPQKKLLFQKRYESFLAELRSLKQELVGETEIKKENYVFIMHPSLGYLGELLSFRQISLEWLGRERSLRDFASIEMLLERYRITTLYAEPGSSVGIVDSLAEKYGLQIIPIDPLKKNVLENIRELARILQDNF